MYIIVIGNYYFILFTNIEKSMYFFMHFLDIFNFHKYFVKIAHFKFFLCIPPRAQILQFMYFLIREISEKYFEFEKNTLNS